MDFGRILAGFLSWLSTLGGFWWKMVDFGRKSRILSKMVEFSAFWKVSSGLERLVEVASV